MQSGGEPLGTFSMKRPPKTGEKEVNLSTVKKNMKDVWNEVREQKKLPARGQFNGDDEGFLPGFLRGANYE